MKFNFWSGIFTGFVLFLFYGKCKINLPFTTFKKIYSSSENLNQENIENFIKKVKTDILSFYKSDELENVVLRNNIKHIDILVFDINNSVVIFDRCFNSSSFVSVLDRTIISTSSCFYNFGKKCTILITIEMKHNLLFIP